MAILFRLLILILLLLIFLLGLGFRLDGRSFRGTWHKFSCLNVDLSFCDSFQELGDELPEVVLGNCIFQDTVLVKLQLSGRVVSKELIIHEFPVVENLAELVSLCLLGWVLVHEEENDSLPDVLEPLLVFPTDISEQRLVLGPELDDAPVEIVEKTANGDVVLVFGSQVFHQLRLRELRLDPLGIGISLSDHLVDIRDCRLYYTEKN